MIKQMGRKNRIRCALFILEMLRMTIRMSRSGIGLALTWQYASNAIAIPAINAITNDRGFETSISVKHDAIIANDKPILLIPPDLANIR
jgi:hypothetical protein